MRGQTLERVVVTRDAAATRALAAALAAAARPGDLISLVGDLGAGKTQFAKGFGAGLGITDTIVSPSFVLMAEYRGRLPLFHVDLYRLADAAEAFAGGLIDERQAEASPLIEWAERLADAHAGRAAGRPDRRRGRRSAPDHAAGRAAPDYLRYLDGCVPRQPAETADPRRPRSRPMTAGGMLAIDTSGTNARRGPGRGRTARSSPSGAGPRATATARSC